MDASVIPYREETLCFGPEARLIGTITQPAACDRLTAILGDNTPDLIVVFIGDAL